MPNANSNARMVGLSGWSTVGILKGKDEREGVDGAVLYAVRTRCRHRATSQICV